MKGFSGTNTHNLEFVIRMCNKYILSLEENGWFVVAYSTDFSGTEKENETANWSRDEIMSVARGIQNADLIDIKFFSHSEVWQNVRTLMNLIGIKRKSFFYMIFRKPTV
jgi:hypothetical protein